MPNFKRITPVALAVLLSAVAAHAQQMMTTSGTPFSTANSSFFERMGMNWSFSRPASGNMGPVNINFGSAGFGNAAPQFGGYAPGAGISGGAGFGLGGGMFNIGGEFSQGSRRSLSSVTPSVTTMNGVPGFVADTSQSPFVISVIPVVGDRRAFTDYGASNTVRGRLLRGELRGDSGSPGSIIPQRNTQPAARPVAPKPQVAAPAPAPQPRTTSKKASAPLILRAADAPQPPAAGGAGNGRAAGGRSSAEVAVASLDDIVARQAAEREATATRQAELASQCYAKGQQAEAEGKLGSARIYYQMALRRASGELKSSVQERLSAIAP